MDRKDGNLALLYQHISESAHKLKCVFLEAGALSFSHDCKVSKLHTLFLSLFFFFFRRQYFSPNIFPYLLVLVFLLTKPSETPFPDCLFWRVLESVVAWLLTAFKLKSQPIKSPLWSWTESEMKVNYASAAWWHHGQKKRHARLHERLIIVACFCLFLDADVRGELVLRGGSRLEQS